MPNIAGSKFNPKTGKYELPAGVKRQTAKTRKEAVKSHKGASGKQISESLRVGARQDRSDSQFAVFAMYPSGRSFLEYVDEPTHQLIAARWGGGRYSVAEQSRNTGEWLGEPVIMDVDRAVHPPKLPGFMVPGQPVMGGIYGGGIFGQQQGFGFPQQQQQQQGPAPDVSELEDELEDVEKELAATKAELAAAKREATEAREALLKERADAQMKSLQEGFERRLADLVNKLDGKKDPMDQLLQFKRVEAELNGPKVGQGGGPLEGITMVLQMMDLMEKMKDKFSGGGGGASGGFMEVLKGVGPLLDRVADMKTANPPPPALQAPAPAAAPAPEGPHPGEEALRAMVDQVGVMTSTGASPASFVAWFKAQQGPAFEAARAVVKTDPPEDFLLLVKNNVPTYADTEQKEAWILEAIRATQADLIGMA